MTMNTAGNTATTKHHSQPNGRIKLIDTAASTDPTGQPDCTKE
ncbi:MAG TPA: hypothetical protein VFQ96_06605 [Microbacteriaceae bacterium]|nr:hypothetical protein [Microbacteriaceae bacterium]